MVSKKQKIAKIFHTDEELADWMLKEAIKKERKYRMDWKRLLHFLGFHCYSTLIKEDEKRKVVKCEFCGNLGVKLRSLDAHSLTVCFSAIFSFFGAFIFSCVLYTLNPFLWSLFLTCLVVFYWDIKIALERMMMA